MDKFNMREDKPEDVRSLLDAAMRRKADKARYELLANLISGKTISVVNNPELYEALNREKMEFEDILKLHPEQAQETMEYVKERKIDQAGTWYSKDSDAWWGEKGAIPPCCYYARPGSYWQNKKLTNHFFNTFTKFRIAESPL